jgi:MarR family transcriptional regulator, 2-MHQ and catechol-resistance regulon repressor
MDLLNRHATELHDALCAFSRAYQFRDRDRICCHDISVTQCHALDVLIRRDRCTLNELAAELYLDKSTASRVVGTLERKGYVARTRHPRDQRAVLLAATAAGQKLYAKITDTLVAERREILASFPPQVRASAAELIRRLTDAVQARAACRPAATQSA